MPVIGDKLQFGTLYDSASKASIAFPEPATGVNNSSLLNLSQYYYYPEEILDTSGKHVYGTYIGNTVEGKEMTWIYVGQLDGGETYICDRPIFKSIGVKNVSRYFLNSNFYAPLEMGIAKSIVEIDGKLYYLRHFNVNMYEQFFKIGSSKGNLPVPTMSDRGSSASPSSTFFKYWNCYYSKEVLDLRYFDSNDRMVTKKSGYDGSALELYVFENPYDNLSSTDVYTVRPALTLIGDVGDVYLSDLKVGSLVSIDGFNHLKDAYFFRIIGKGQDGSGNVTVKVNFPEMLGKKYYNADDSGLYLPYETNDYAHCQLLRWLNATGDAGEWFEKEDADETVPSYASEPGFLNALYKTYNIVSNVLSSAAKRYYKSNGTGSQSVRSLSKYVHLLNAKERTSEDIGSSFLDGTLYQLFDQDLYSFVDDEIWANNSQIRETNQQNRFNYDSLFNLGNSSNKVLTRDGSPKIGDAMVKSFSCNYGGEHLVEDIDSMVFNEYYYIPILFLKDTLKVKAGYVGIAVLTSNVPPVITPESKDYGELNSPIVIDFTVNDADGDNYSGSVMIDNSPEGSFKGVGTGMHTIDLNDYWDSLEVSKHTIRIMVFDSKTNLGQAVYTFTKTNNPTVAPVVNEPLNNARVENIFPCEFVLVNDVEGDDQTVRVQIANNDKFNNVLKEFDSNFEVYNDLTSEWESHVDNVFTNDYAGKRIRINIDATVNAKKFYLRVVTIDSGSSVAVSSSTITLNKGNRLEIQTHPLNYDHQPQKVVVILEKMISTGATSKTYVTNNANDDLPVWEEYSPVDNGMHTFENTVKLAEQWGVAVKFEADAGTATGEVSISRVGIGVL